MTQQEQFEADFLAAMPQFCKIAGRHDWNDVAATYSVWLQQAKRHEAEIAELVAALKPFSELLQKHNSGGLDETPIFGINFKKITVGDLRSAVAAIAKYEVKK